MSLLDLLFGPPNIENLKSKTDVHGLIKALEYPKESIVRQKAAEALGEIADSQAVSSLLESLNDAEVEVRYAAIKSLGQIGDKQAVKPLIAMLKDKKPLARQAASNALGQIGDSQAVKPLIAALSDKDSFVRDEVARALGQIGDVRAVKPLVDALIANDGLEQAVGYAMKKIGRPAVNPLIAALENDDRKIRAKVAYILEKIGKPTVSSLVVLLKSENDNLRQAATDVLEKLGWQPNKDEFGAAYWITKQQWDKCVGIGAPAVEPLLVLLGDKDWVVRWAVAKALGQIGDPRAVQSLMFAMGDADANVRQAAAEALGQIGDARAIDPLVAILKETDSKVRSAIIVALIKIGQPSVNPVAAMLKSRNVCKAAVEILDKLGWQPEKNEQGAIYWITKQQFNKCIPIGALAVKPLMEALKDGNETTRQTVADILKRIGAPAIESLTMLLEDTDGNLRQLAAETLHNLGWQPHVSEASITFWIARQDWHKCVQIGAAAVGPLIAALNDSTMEIRQGAAETLGEIGDSRAIEPLVIALTEPRPIRLSAAEALNKLGWVPDTLELNATYLVAKEQWDACVELGVEAVEFLTVALYDWDNWEVSKSAAQTLGRIGGAEVVGSLTKAFKDMRGSLEMRRVTAEILGQIGDIRTIDSLIAVINNPNEIVDIHRIATKTLEQFNHPQAQNWFIIRKHIADLENKNGEVRRGAAEALAIIYQHGNIDEQSRKLIFSKQAIMAERHHDEVVLSCNWTHHHDNGIGIML